MYDEVNTQYVGLGLHLSQILILLLCPGICYGLIHLVNERELACIIAGAVLLTINLICMIIAYCFSRKQKDFEADEAPNCFSKRGFLFLFPVKQSLTEAVWCSIVTFAYGFFMTYAFHTKTINAFYIFKLAEEDYLTFILIGLAGYSLFSERCPESAIYSDNELEFGFGSNHYQRPLYFILCALAMVGCEL